MIGLTLSSGLLSTTGSSWSREVHEEIRAAEAREIVPTDFDGLCRYMGYGKGIRVLRNAIGRATTRKTIIERLNTAGIRFQNNDIVLADSFLREIGADAAPVLHLEAAE